MKFRVYVPAVAAILAVSCGRQRAVEADAKPSAIFAPVAKVTTGNLTQTVVLTAEFRPFQEIDVHAKVAGYLKKINVDVGDRVHAGQLLATLEIPEMDDDLTRAAAAKRRSDAELTRARDELARSESAHTVSHLSYMRLAAVLKSRPNLVAQQEIDEAQGRDRVSEAVVSSAKAALSAAEQQVAVAKADVDRVKTLSAYSQITAPFSGVITKRYADTGAMIQAGTASQSQAMPVARLSQVDLLRLIVPVPESMVPKIRIGESMEVGVPTLNRSFSGKVARFSGKVQSSTRTMDTEIDVPNPSQVLLPGMYAQVVLTLEKRDHVLAAPLGAIAGHETNPTILVVNSGVVEERPVKLGLETADRVEILNGLGEGDLVIVGSRSQFRRGQRVHPKVIVAADLKGAE